MKIQKHKLLQIVRESQFDMDEMASFHSPQSRPIEDKDGKVVGHRMKHGSKEDVKDKLKGSELPASVVIYTCGEEVTRFIENHQDLLEHIKEIYFNDLKKKFRDTHLQNTEIIFTNEKKCPKYLPYRNPKQYFDAQGNPIQTGIPHIPDEVTGQMYKLREAINRVLKAKLFGETDKETGVVLSEGLMNDEELNNHLTECSIPSFKVRDRKYEDRHDVANTNQRIHYGSDAFILYESANDFLGDVLNRTVGLESDIEKRNTHLARLRNNTYTHWSETKKNKKEYLGLTDIYKLEKYGLAEKNYDVNIYSKFDIVGKLDNYSSFTWVFSFEVYYGKKITIDQLIAGNNVKLFKRIRTNKTVNFDPQVYSYPEIKPDTQVPVTSHIMANPIVVNGLIEAINEFKNKIMGISVNDALEMANYFQYEIGQEIDESFNKIIKKVIKESGMKKKIKIKIKESDLIKIISESVIKKLTEENFDDFITKYKSNKNEAEIVKPNDEVGQDDEVNQDEVGQDEVGQDDNINKLYVTLGKDENGIYYVMKDTDTDHPKVLATTR